MGAEEVLVEWDDHTNSKKFDYYKTFLLFLQSRWNKDVLCIPKGSDTIQDLNLSGKALEQTGCVDFSDNWISFVWGFAMAARIFKYERRLRAFEVVGKLAWHFMQM